MGSVERSCDGGRNSGFRVRDCAPMKSGWYQWKLIPLLCSAVFRFTVFISWLLVVACGTGWASTARLNNSAFHIHCHPSAAPSFGCTDHWYHFNWLIFHQDTLTGRFGYHVASLNTKFQSFPSKADFTHVPSNMLRHPLRKINMRALGISFLARLIDRGTGHLPPLHSLGVCFIIFLVAYAVALLLVSISNCQEATFYPFFAAGRRATARTTETLSHAAFRQKKGITES